MARLNELVLEIDKEAETFKAESQKHLGGNKSAGTRARKASLNLDKLLKQYRKLSVA